MALFLKHWKLPTPPLSLSTSPSSQCASNFSIRTVSFLKKLQRNNGQFCSYHNNRTRNTKTKTSSQSGMLFYPLCMYRNGFLLLLTASLKNGLILVCPRAVAPYPHGHSGFACTINTTGRFSTHTLFFPQLRSCTLFPPQHFDVEHGITNIII